MVEPIDLDIMYQDFAQLERLGARYNYGGKARTDLHHCSLNAITPEMLVADGSVDCSGYSRWAIARATNNLLIIPDGSQNQREWAEAPETGLHKVAKYSDAATYMTATRLFICFIKPFANGCGSVGHVWFLSHFNFGNQTKAGSLECHGGGGCISRPWDYPTLAREVYSCYELPTK